MTEEKPKKVRFGTEALNATFEGEIVECEIRPGDRTFDGKPARDQLFIRIKPLDRNIPEESWPLAWYSVSYSPNSKWAELQTRLERMNALPENDDPANLVGKVFEWERINISFGRDRESGEILEAKGVLMPKRLIKTTNRKPEPPKTPTMQVKIDEEPRIEIDLKKLIMETIEKEPIIIEKFYYEIQKKFGKNRADIFRAMKELESEGKLEWNAKDGIITKVV